MEPWQTGLIVQVHEMSDITPLGRPKTDRWAAASPATARVGGRRAVRGGRRGAEACRGGAACGRVPEEPSVRRGAGLAPTTEAGM